MIKIKFFFILCISVSLLGCAVGKDSILFVTKTSIAVDVDTNPATFDVGYGRYEGSVAPVVGDGQALPLISSISADAGITSGVFGSGVAQNFGVGNAAVIMSQYLGSSLNPSKGVRKTFTEITSTPASIKRTEGMERRYFFGTKTTVGLSTSFAAERGYTPDSISLGYKRKELAYVPIRKNGKGNSKTLSIPSMLATSGNASNTAINEAGFSVNQFYATGSAANYLAANPVIRNTVFDKIIGDDKVHDELKIERDKNELEERKQAKVDAMLTSIDGLTDDAATKLASTPPTSDKKVLELLDRIDEKNLRRTDANIARRMLKTQVVYFERTDGNLALWESAIAGLPKKEEK